MSAEPGGRRVGRAVREVATWVAIAVATVAALEGVASLYLLASDVRGIRPPRHLSRAHSVPDTLLGWRNAPGFTDTAAYGAGIEMSTTPEGFRSSPEAGASSPALVCSGDSYTFGLGIADDRHWCARLAQRLGMRGVDMAQDNYGLDQLHLWYQRDGRAVPAAMHLIGVTNATLERAVTADPAGWYEPHLELDGERLVLRGVPVPRQTWASLRRARVARAVDELRLVEAIHRVGGSDPQSARDAAVDEHRPIIERLLGAVADVDRQWGRRLVVVYLPTPRDIRPGTLDARRTWLAEAARKRGIDLVDLTPELRRLRRDSIDLVFISRLATRVKPEAVGQYSKLGHDWVAAALASHLRPIVASELKVDERLGSALRAPDQQ